MNIAHWPYDQPEREQELLRDALATCETTRQQEQVLGMFLLSDVLTDILLTPPVWRKHWWQFWRMRSAEVRDQR